MVESSSHRTTCRTATAARRSGLPDPPRLLARRQFAPELGGDYQDCRRRAYAERIIDAYMRRYAAEA
ncbi:MAG: hypothetical protein R3F29_14345 [Planctomycetota bacterium]